MWRGLDFIILKWFVFHAIQTNYEESHWALKEKDHLVLGSYLCGQSFSGIFFQSGDIFILLFEPFCVDLTAGKPRDCV